MKTILCLRNALLFSALLLFISGCATRVISLKEDKDIHLQEDEGYLLLAVDTSIDLNKIFITGEKNIMLTEQDLEAGTNYILINLPAGNYEFEKINLNSYWRLTLKQDIWDFQVKSNAISYIGHFKFKNFFSGFTTKLALENKSTDALEFMEEKFPKILATKAMIYGRVEQDRFFELVAREAAK